jgi:hypothetical protein
LTTYRTRRQLLVKSLLDSGETLGSIVLLGACFNFIFAVFGHTYIGDSFGFRCLDLGAVRRATALVYLRLHIAVDPVAPE